MNKLTDTTMVTRQVTFTVPHVLLKYDAVTFPTLTLRQGGSTQVDATVSTDFYDGPVDERDNLFVVKARNQINFGALRIEVLNDAITGDKPISPSAPTATEYMDNVGKTVMIGFTCSRSDAHSRTAGQDVFMVVRSTITLP